MQHYFIRTGAFAEIEVAESELTLPRGARVLMRSARGVELGEVVSPAQRRVGAQSEDPTLGAADTNDSLRVEPSARVLRIAGSEDELLLRRLDRHKRRAIEKCRAGLARRKSEATLLDIDHLFDGRSIVLHFLGQVDPETERHVRDIASEYESVVRTGALAKLMSEGCGEGCGTDAAKGCGGGCAGCSVAAVCHTSTSPSSGSPKR